VTRQTLRSRRAFGRIPTVFANICNSMRMFLRYSFISTCRHSDAFISLTNVLDSHTFAINVGANLGLNKRHAKQRRLRLSAVTSLVWWGDTWNCPHSRDRLTAQLQRIHHVKLWCHAACGHVYTANSRHCASTAAAAAANPPARDTCSGPGRPWLQSRRRVWANHESSGDYGEANLQQATEDDKF
jgi:hypothetical protein